MSTQVARLGGGVVGAIAGSFVGQPALGFALGSTIGGLIVPGDPVKGPRLDDIQVSSAGYGTPIPTVFGTDRIAGNLLWCPGFLEHKTESSAKGGPKIVSFTYTANCAYWFAKGEIDGLRKVWADGILLLNFASDATPEEIEAGYQLFEGVRIYNGSETQDPDALIESFEGILQTPAHRGMAYIVFDDLDLEQFGQRLPNLRAEVINNGTPAYELSPSTSAQPSSPHMYPILCRNGIIRYATEKQSTNFPPNESGTMSGRITLHTFGGEFVDLATIRFAPLYPDIEPPDPQNDTTLLSFTDRPTVFDPIQNAPGGDDVRLAAATRDQNWDHSGIVSDTRFMWLINGQPGAGSSEDTSIVQMSHGIYFDGQYYVADGTSYQNPTAILRRFEANVLGAPAIAASASRTFSDPVWGVHQDAGRLYVLYGADAQTGPWHIEEVDPLDLSNVATWGPFSTSHSRPSLAVFGDIALIGSSTTAGYAVLQLPSGGGSPTTVATGNVTDAFGTSLQPCPGPGLLFTRDTFLTPYAFSDAGIPLSEIVEDICVESDLEASEYDVTGLSAVTVRGYTRTRVMSGRDALEPLRIVYQFDIVDSGGIIKFKLRENATEIAVAEDDWGVAADGQNPEGLQITRADDLQIPRVVSISHKNPDKDFDVGEQHSIYPFGESTANLSIQAPLVLTADEARQRAEIVHTSLRTERTRYSGTLPAKYMKVEPGDVLTTTVEGVAHKIRVQDVRLLLPGAIQIEGVAHEAAAFTSLATSDGGTAGNDRVGSPGPTNAELLDIAPVGIGESTGAGFFVSARGLRDDWTGTTIYVSTDNGQTFAEAGQITQSAVMGQADTALATGPHLTPDEGNTVDVEIFGDDTLSGTTEANWLAGEANTALLQVVDDEGTTLGWEVLSYKDVSLVSGNIWRLSNLIRGRQCTERFKGEHAIGDRFILLDEDSTVFVATNPDMIGKEITVRMVSNGQRFADGIDQKLTVNASHLEPCPPGNISGDYDSATGDVLINWHRRARLNGEWRDKVDVPLIEASESYEIDIHSTVSPWNTTKETTNVTYSNSDKTAEFKGTTGRALVIGTKAQTRGRWYCEFEIVNNNFNGYVGFGIEGDHVDGGAAPGSGGSGTDGVSLFGNSSSDSVGVCGTDQSYGNGFTDGDVVGAVLDIDAQTVEFFLNNVSQGELAVSCLSRGDNIVPAASLSHNSGQNVKITLRTTVADFTYAVPTGAKEWGGDENSPVLRTLTATESQVNYEGTDRTTDGLTGTLQIPVSIYQISETVGRGHAGVALLQVGPV